MPPTEEAQLPDNYQEVYAQQRLDKNARLTKYLQALGMESLAERIANDPTIREEQPFNPVKTWIEYVNRLIGVIIGLLIFGTVAASLVFWRSQRSIVWFSLSALLLTVIQAWIGSIVVSTNLLHGMINVHMFLAIIIVGLLIYAMFKAQSHKADVLPSGFARKVNLLVAAGVLTMVVQIALGVEVRAMVDTVARSFGYSQRSEWINQLPIGFKVHRTFSLLILGLHLGLVWVLLKVKKQNESLWKWGRYLAIITILEIVTGAIMGYFSIPAFIQPVHLLFATIIMGVQFYVLLLVNKKESMQAQPA